jgi:hypothetical protein
MFSQLNDVIERPKKAYKYLSIMKTSGKYCDQHRNLVDEGGGRRWINEVNEEIASTID